MSADVAPGYLLRWRLGQREVFEKRWTTMKQFYKRMIGDNKVLVCRACEKKTGEPMLAARVVVMFDGPSLWAQCLGCGERERVGTAI